MAVALSVVVVAHDMNRELPRTLRSLRADYQRGVEPDEYELIVVDNGSPAPINEESVAGAGVRSRVARHLPPERSTWGSSWPRGS